MRSEHAVAPTRIDGAPAVMRVVPTAKAGLLPFSQPSSDGPNGLRPYAFVRPKHNGPTLVVKSGYNVARLPENKCHQKERPEPTSSREYVLGTSARNTEFF